MAFTYGCYNYDPNDLAGDKKIYDAAQISRIFDGIISDGIYSNFGNCFKVVATDTNNVIIKSGRAWFNHTWNYNDKDMYFEMAVAPTVYDRYDTLVIEVNWTARHNEFKWVIGDEAEEPERKELTNNDTLAQYPIAYIRRRAGIQTITQSSIEMCVGNELSPFVTGILNNTKRRYYGKLSAGTTAVTFSNVNISTESMVSVCSEDPTLEYKNITVNGNTVTVTFDPQTNHKAIYLVVTNIPSGD